MLERGDSRRSGLSSVWGQLAKYKYSAYLRYSTILELGYPGIDITTNCSLGDSILCFCDYKYARQHLRSRAAGIISLEVILVTRFTVKHSRRGKL